MEAAAQTIDSESMSGSGAADQSVSSRKAGRNSPVHNGVDQSGSERRAGPSTAVHKGANQNVPDQRASQSAANRKGAGLNADLSADPSADGPELGWVLVDEPDVLLVTRNPKEDYRGLVLPEQIIQIHHLEEIQAIERFPDAFLFIHSDCFATKEQFALDQLLKPLKRKYRYVGGTPVSAVRKMISYLEGDLAHEITA
jgi:hypothetical protein